MNTKHFQLLHGAIKNAPEKKFGMPRYFYDKTKPLLDQETIIDPQSLYSCNTAACIFGWAAFVSEFEPKEELSTLALHAHVCDFLEISSGDGEFIAEGDWSRKPMRAITKNDALEYLSKVIETGRIRFRLLDEE